MAPLSRTRLVDQLLAAAANSAARDCARTSTDSGEAGCALARIRALEKAGHARLCLVTAVQRTGQRTPFFNQLENWEM